MSSAETAASGTLPEDIAIHAGTVEAA